jgi:hypothetical protein
MARMRMGFFGFDIQRLRLKRVRLKMRRWAKGFLAHHRRLAKVVGR